MEFNVQMIDEQLERIEDVMGEFARRSNDDEQLLSMYTEVDCLLRVYEEVLKAMKESFVYKI